MLLSLVVKYAGVNWDAMATDLQVSSICTVLLQCLEKPSFLEKPNPLVFLVFFGFWVFWIFYLTSSWEACWLI